MNINEFREPELKYGVDANYLKDIMFIGDEDVKIAKEKLIDLVEIGDYVNGFLIDYIDSERRYLRSERPYREHDTTYKALMEQGRDYNQCLHFFAEDIKSIVTKEQFESMKYEVE